VIRAGLILRLAFGDLQPVLLVLPHPVDERHEFIRQLGECLLKQSEHWRNENGPAGSTKDDDPLIRQCYCLQAMHYLVNGKADRIDETNLHHWQLVLFFAIHNIL